MEYLIRNMCFAGNITSMTNKEKVKELMLGIDKNTDGIAGPWELYDWMEWVERVYHQV